MALVFCAALLEGQDVVFSEDINYPETGWVTSGIIGQTSYTVSRSGSDWGAKVNSDQMLSLTNNATSSSNSQGWVYAYTPTSGFDQPYSSILSENPGLVTWYLNIRQRYTELEGFGTSQYGIAYFLAGQGTTKSQLTGYALLIGQSGADPMRIASVSPGFVYTNIVTSTGAFSDLNTQYLSIKVTYDPASHEWNLYLRNDGSSFLDPRTGELTLQGSGTNSDHTSVGLPYSGAYYQGSTTNVYAYYDNYAVTVDGGTVPVQLTHFRASQAGLDRIRVKWVSQSETGLAGYRVYRSDQQNLSLAQNIGSLIPATNTSQTQSYVYLDNQVSQSGEFYYWLESVELDGSNLFHGPAICAFDPGGNAGEPQIPVFTGLDRVFPNPFNPSCSISYQLAEESPVRLDVYNAGGCLVRSFVQGLKFAGEHSVTWDGKDRSGKALPSGVYLILMEAGGTISRSKVLLLK